MSDTIVTRHSRFVEIMRAAAGDSAATYGGTKPFWELPIEELKTARLDGIPLVAPEDAGSSTATYAPACCSTTRKPAGPTASSGAGDARPR